jgi:hypothetical protein
MKTLFSIFLFVSFFNLPTISEIRKAYPSAANSEKSAITFSSKFTIIAEEDKVLLAYKGASVTIVAKFKKKVSEKISTFKEGAKLIELAVAAEPNDIEIRLIRLSIQENTPGIVKYKKNIPDDKAFILKYYKDQSLALKEYIKSFVSQSKSFSEQEKQSLK